jgi:hypothetical protein
MSTEDKQFLTTFDQCHAYLKCFNSLILFVFRENLVVRGFFLSADSLILKRNMGQIGQVYS